MAEKPANEDLSQNIPGVFNTADMEFLYEGYMDSMLLLMGRTVRVWLPPAQNPSTNNPSQHNPWFNSKDPRLGPASEGSSGRSVEPIFADYTAHIVHGPSPISNSRPFELEIGDVQLTTVIGSKPDLDSAVEVEVDGQKYDMKKVDERQVGFQTPKYVISIWTRKAQN